MSLHPNYIHYITLLLSLPYDQKHTNMNACAQFATVNACTHIWKTLQPRQTHTLNTNTWKYKDWITQMFLFNLVTFWSLIQWVELGFFLTTKQGFLTVITVLFLCNLWAKIYAQVKNKTKHNLQMAWLWCFWMGLWDENGKEKESERERKGDWWVWDKLCLSPLWLPYQHDCLAAL